jgi:hypothetical protein
MVQAPFRINQQGLLQLMPAKLKKRKTNKIKE